MSFHRGQKRVIPDPEMANAAASACCRACGEALDFDHLLDHNGIRSGRMVAFCPHCDRGAKKRKPEPSYQPPMCQVCNEPIVGRQPQAKTCGEVCAHALNRKAQNRYRLKIGNDVKRRICRTCHRYFKPRYPNDGKCGTCIAAARRKSA